MLSPSEDAEFRPSARLLVPRIEGNMYNDLVSPDPGGQSAAVANLDVFGTVRWTEGTGATSVPHVGRQSSKDDPARG